MKKKNLLTRVIIISVITLVGLYLVIGPRHRPSLKDFSWSGIKASLAHNIHLGLDLQGGSHLVMRVKTESYLKDLTEANSSAAQNAAKEAGFEVKSGRADVGTGNYRIVIELADPSKAKEAREAVEKKVELNDTSSWTFTIEGLVEQPTTWTWDQMHALPQDEYNGAIHCVTTWSKFDMQWRGVSLDTLLAIARPQPTATHVVAYSSTGYTTNLPLADVTDGKAWVAFAVDGAPLSRDHGGPARLLVPHLYFWKSAKFVAGLRVLDHDEPGFWEERGYHDRGDPWLEQRYQGD